MAIPLSSATGFLIARFQESKGKILKKAEEIAQEEFKKLPGFQTTIRNGNVVYLRTYLERRYDAENNSLILRLKTKGTDLKRVNTLLDQDEKGVGSLGIDPKATVWKFMSYSSTLMANVFKAKIKQ